jgi:uncharacterized membrane protein (UPF0127 family)
MRNIKVKYLKTHLERTIGLIGKNQIEPVLIKTRFGIHTIGVKFNIDILILNSNNKVVQIKESLPPNNIFIWNPKYNIVLELPEKFIFRHRIKKGDILNING